MPTAEATVSCGAAPRRPAEHTNSSTPDTNPSTTCALPGPRGVAYSAPVQPIPESGYVALANVADFAAWRAAVARFFRDAPAPPGLAAFVTTRGGRLAFRGPHEHGPVLLDPEDDWLSFLRHRKDIALPLDRDAALGFVRFLRALTDLGRSGPAPPLPTLAGSVRALAPGGEQVWVVCWWRDVHEGPWTAAVHDRLVRLAPLMAQSVLRLEQVAAQARQAFEALDHLRGVLERRTPGAAGHGDRVGRYARAVATLLAAEPAFERPLRPADVDTVALAGAYHDLGKLHLDPAMLERPGQLSRREWLDIARHPLLARGFLAAHDETARLLPAVEAHHERWDGSGYPHGLAGEAIPLAARIVAVCDTFDAVTHDHPYREARPVDEALEVLRAGAGSAFDPQVVAAFGAARAEGALDLAWALHAEDADRFPVAEEHARAGLGRPAATPRARRNRLELLQVFARVRARGGHHGDAEAALDEAAALDPTDPRVPLARAHMLHHRRAGPADTRAALDAVFARGGGPHALRAQASARHLMANLERVAGHREAALAQLVHARRLVVMQGDIEREGQVLDTLGNVHLWSGDLGEARRRFADSQLIKIQCGDHQGQAINLGNQARLAFFEGDLDEARRLFAQNLELSRDLGDPRGEVVTLNGLGLTHLWAGDLDAAEACFAAAREAAVGNPWGAFYAADGAVQVALARGADAGDALDACDALAERLDEAQPRAVVILLRALAAPSVDALWTAFERLLAVGAPTSYEQARALGALRALADRGATLPAEAAAALAARRADRLGWVVDLDPVVGSAR